MPISVATIAQPDTGPTLQPHRRAYLVGGGIASMAAAAIMIRDGDMLGHDITIIEQLNRLGGSLDGAGSPEGGYVLRGGRMFESKYVCTYELFASIPTLDHSRTVTDEILKWNETIHTSSKSRLFRNGQRQTAPKFGLSERHILTIERLAIEPEQLLGRSRSNCLGAAGSQINSIRHSSRPISGSCGAPPSPSSPGTALSSSNAILSVFPIWSTALNG